MIFALLALHLGGSERRLEHRLRRVGLKLVLMNDLLALEQKHVHDIRKHIVQRLKILFRYIFFTHFKNDSTKTLSIARSVSACFRSPVRDMHGIFFLELRKHCSVVRSVVFHAGFRINLRFLFFY